VNLDSIRNFRLFDPRLATAGQPDEGQIRELAEAGYQLVVNLGLDDPAYALADERATVEGQGMAYRHIPVDFSHPADSDFQRFMECMRTHARQRVFVHCRLNWRVSVFVALYAERELGWDSQRADAYIAGMWSPDPTWQAFIEAQRGQP